MVYAPAARGRVQYIIQSCWDSSAAVRGFWLFGGWTLCRRPVWPRSDGVGGCRGWRSGRLQGRTEWAAAAAAWRQRAESRRSVSLRRDTRLPGLGWDAREHSGAIWTDLEGSRRTDRVGSPP